MNWQKNKYLLAICEGFKKVESQDLKVSFLEMHTYTLSNILLGEEGYKTMDWTDGNFRLWGAKIKLNNNVPFMDVNIYHEFETINE